VNQIPSPDVLERALFEIVSSTDFIGYVASALVLLTFCMQTIVPLRFVALTSNFAFISYAWATKLFPILVLHCLLALINLVSLSKALSAPKCGSTMRPSLSTMSSNTMGHNASSDDAAGNATVR
jgi:hypothetical protein